MSSREDEIRRRVQREVEAAPQTLAGQWPIYERIAISPKAGDAQREDMRDAFFQGAATMLALIDRAARDDETDEQGAARLQTLASELDAYVAAKNAKYAREQGGVR